MSPEIDQILPNMKVKIRIDAFADRIFDGTVLDVAPRPDRAILASTGSTIYPTHIRIENPPRSARPGMTAEVQILIAELDNVLSVPAESAIRLDGQWHVAVKKPNGGFELRVVTLGISNDQQVEVKEGIRDGEIVILNPLAPMTEEEKRKHFGGPPRITPPAAATVPAKTPPHPKKARRQATTSG